MRAGSPPLAACTTERLDCVQLKVDRRAMSRIGA